MNSINHLLQAYGSTLDVERPSFQKQGNDGDLRQLVDELRAGKVQALIVCGMDLIHSLPNSDELIEAVKKVPLVVSTADREDDFSVLAHFVCPDHHVLESWLDAEPVDGQLSLSQPLLQPLGQTRSLLESLSVWSGSGSGKTSTALELLQTHWRETILPRAGDLPFQAFWDRSLHDGVVAVRPRGAPVGEFQSSAVELMPTSESTGWQLELYARVGLPESRHAHNPWLQELPDPITKTTWDNFVQLSPKAADELGVTDGDVVRIAVTDGGEAIELPVLIQPGQHDRVIAIPLGGEFGMLILVTGNWHAIARLESELARLGESAGLSLQVRRTEPRALREELIPYSIDVIGPDHAGIVSGLAGFFTARHIEIAEIVSRGYNASQTGAAMFAVQMMINVPARAPVAPNMATGRSGQCN